MTVAREKCMPDKQRRTLKAACRVFSVSLALLPALSLFEDVDDREAAPRGHGEIGGSSPDLSRSDAASGEHFDLNIIGTPSNPDVAAGGCIFVSLGSSTRIWIAEGDFAVLDGDGTDGAAQFQLPVSAEGDGVTHYSVFARVLGKSGGAATLTPCASDPATGERLCSTDSLLLVQSGGERRDDISNDLLFIDADTDEDGGAEPMSLFDDRLRGIVWQFDENGMRRAQLRFYPIE
jgi:hypothetical protein